MSSSTREATPASRRTITSILQVDDFDRPPPGTYAGPQSVVLTTSTAGATIRYTIDGSNPTDSNGTFYSGPVPIGATTTLKAIASSRFSTEGRPGIQRSGRGSARNQSTKARTATASSR